MFPFLRFADCICATRSWSVQLSREADVEFLIEEVNEGWACNVSGLCLMPWSPKWSNVASSCRRQTFPFFAMSRFVVFRHQAVESKVEPSHGETHVRPVARRRQSAGSVLLIGFSVSPSFLHRTHAVSPCHQIALRLPKNIRTRATSREKRGLCCRWARCSTMPPCCTSRQRVGSRIAPCKAWCRRVRLRLGQTTLCNALLQITTSSSNPCSSNRSRQARFKQRFLFSSSQSRVSLFTCGAALGESNVICAIRLHGRTFRRSSYDAGSNRCDSSPEKMFREWRQSRNFPCGARWICTIVPDKTNVSARSYGDLCWKDKLCHCCSLVHPHGGEKIGRIRFYCISFTRGR